MPTTRWIAAAAAGVLVATLLGSVALRAANRPWRPKQIVLFTVDTLRAERLGCYGHGAPTSPHIDAWSRDTVLFERATAQAPWTVPSLASLFTGLYPAEAGTYTNETGISPALATLPEILQHAGYKTASFNSHLLLLREDLGFARGFDEVYPSDREPLLGGEHKLAFAQAEGSLMEWIERNADEPIFLWIHNMDPHHPETPGNPYLDDPEWDKYDAEVRWVDESFARIVAKLQAADIWDDALIVFSADHGEAFGEHDLIGHQDVMYDEVLRIPLLFQYRRIREPARLREPVDLLDVFPTILEIAGIPIPPQTRGESLVPLLEGTAKRRAAPHSFHSRYFFEDGHHEASIRDRRWKLLVRTQPSESRLGGAPPDWDRRREEVRAELFNLSVDPEERRNLAGEHPQVVERLAARLDDWKDSLTHPSEAAPRLEPADFEILRGLGYEPSN